MNTVTPLGKTGSKTAVSTGESPDIPWLQLRARIREALSERNHYVASSEDLSLLWRGERIDASERRRRITVFAAQHQWRVETRADCTTARFQPAPVSGLREILSRNHE
ncbi:MAG: hypothetical protein ABJF10_24695 [Chthoniobacter sp.]|uniref:hypothetical protein n=1 Tax=Chthoniobacter sp. TaxID=2510640 RepID=UPI0032A9C18D